MADEILRKFKKVSEEADKMNVKHFVLVVSEDKKINMEGSNYLVKGIIDKKRGL